MLNSSQKLSDYDDLQYCYTIQSLCMFNPALSNTSCMQVVSKVISFLGRLPWWQILMPISSVITNNVPSYLAAFSTGT